MARKRLLISEIDSVGAVDEPDNPPASLLFWKRRRKHDTPDPGAVEKGVLMDGETVAEPETQEAAVTETVEQPDIIKAEPEPEGEGEDVAKRVEAEREEVAKARAERDAAVAQLAEEVEKRLDGEWVEKARPYTLLLGAPETMGPVLRKIAQTAPEQWTVLEAAFRSAVERTDLAKILTEVGTDSGTADPIGRRDQFVKEQRTLHPNMSEAEARAKFWALNPDAKKASREGV